jgi:trypsin
MPSDSGIEKIIGGETADIGKYPYFVQGPGCAGALVAPDIVLWAAHCGNIFDQNELVIGAYNDTTLEEGAQSRFCDTWIFDDRYQTGCDPNRRVDINWDFSLCKLDKPVTDLANPKNINIVVNFEDNVPAEGDDLLVMGFGNTAPQYASFLTPEILQDIAVPYITNEDCDIQSRYDGRITEQMLCAGFDDSSKNTCQGDSGAPIVRRTTDDDGNIVDIHLGIASWGFGCADNRFPGVYSRTSKGIGWIVEKTCNEFNSPADYCPPGTEFRDETCPGPELIVTTETDGFASETSWEVREIIDQESGQSEQIKYRHHRVKNYRYEHAPICLKFETCYDFRIFDNTRNGLCFYGLCPGFYMGEINGEQVFGVFGDDTDFGISDTRTFCTGLAPEECVDRKPKKCSGLDKLRGIKLKKVCKKKLKFRNGRSTQTFNICQASCARVGLGPCV